MLTEMLNTQIAVGLLQCAGAILLCLAVVSICRRFGVSVERETVISLARGLIQMSIVGVLLATLLKGGLLVGATVLLAMVGAAAFTTSQRFSELSYAFEISFLSIGSGAGTSIAFMVLTKGLSTDIQVFVPVGSMIIANSMNASAQAMERFRSDVTAHIGQVEAALCLGAEPYACVSPYVQTAVYASLLPRLDMLKSLGLVWIPGVMAGMMVAGSSPLYAALYQFVIVTAIMIASAIAGMTVIAVMRRRAFSPAGQLLLRNPTAVEKNAFWGKFLHRNPSPLPK
jgi:putative ABC transport system permease protein